MDVATDAGLASEPTPIAITPPADTPERLSATDAARLLRSLRRPREGGGTEQSAPERAAPVEHPRIKSGRNRPRRQARKTPASVIPAKAGTRLPRRDCECRSGS